MLRVPSPLTEDKRHEAGTCLAVAWAKAEATGVFSQT
jgi:hypothetical protein